MFVMSPATASTWYPPRSAVAYVLTIAIGLMSIACTRVLDFNQAAQVSAPEPHPITKAPRWSRLTRCRQASRRGRS